MKKAFALLFFSVFIMGHSQFRVNYDKGDKNTSEDYKQFSYGYFLGLNYFDFKIHPDENGINDYGRFDVVSEGKMGFSAGLMGKMKLNNYFDLLVQPGVHFTERTLKFTNLTEGLVITDDINNVFEPYEIQAADAERTIKSSYIDIPILLKMHGDRWFNTRPYLQTGVGYALNMQSEEASEDDNADGIFRLKSHSFNYQVELGVAIYFSRFKLTPSVKGMFFFNNELVADDPTTPPIWANSMKSMHTRAVMFSIKFE